MTKPTLPDPRNVRDGGTPNEQQRIDALVNERVAAAIKAATEPLQAQIAHLRSNRDAIIAEKRKLEGRARKDAEERADARPKAIDFAITREQARNPQEYRRARDEAAKHGLPLMILDDQKTELGTPPEVFQTDSHYHVFGPSIKGDTQAYFRHKAEAERLGLRFHCAYSAAEMPREAFGTGDGQ